MDNKYNAIEKLRATICVTLENILSLAFVLTRKYANRKRWLPEFEISETGDNKLIPSNESFNAGINSSSSPVFPQSSFDDDDFMNEVEIMEKKPRSTKVTVNSDEYVLNNEQEMYKKQDVIYISRQ